MKSVIKKFLVMSGAGAVVLAAVTMSGCAMLGGGSGSTSLSTSPTMPAAEGGAVYSVTKNDNTRIALSVKHLAHPEKLTPPASSYIVWTRATKDAPAQSIGALVVDKNLTGELDAETPLHSFALFITAEASGQVQQPAGQPLLWTNYSR
jgi:hypothetical protein